MPNKRTFTPEQLLKMDWLCDNVIGTIAEYGQLLPESRAMVRELGICRDRIDTEREVRSCEDFDHLR